MGNSAATVDVQSSVPNEMVNVPFSCGADDSAAAADVHNGVLGETGNVPDSGGHVGLMDVRDSAVAVEV